MAMCVHFALSAEAMPVSSALFMVLFIPGFNKCVCYSGQGKQQALFFPPYTKVFMSTLALAVPLLD